MRCAGRKLANAATLAKASANEIDVSIFALLCEPLFDAQGVDRIDAQRATNRNHAGDQRNDEQHAGDSAEHDWIRGARSEQKAAQNTRRGQGTAETEDNANCRERDALPNHELCDAPGAGA
jgi:hypothetical protein